MLKENSLSLDPINSFHMCTFSAFRYKAVNGTALKVKVMFLASFTLFFLTFFFYYSTPDHKILHITQS